MAKLIAANKEIKSLTGVRGLAALYVAFYHWLSIRDFSNYSTYKYYFYNFINHGYLSVDLFFILSGYVLGLTYLNKYETNKTKLYKSFLLKRFARIYPLFFIMILVYLFLYKYLPGFYKAYSFSTIFLNFTFLQPWLPINSIIPTAWSLSGEFLAYFAFPIFCYFIFRIKSIKAFFFTLIFIFFILILISYVKNPSFNGFQIESYGPLDVWSGWAMLLKCFSEFFLGMLMYRMFSTNTVNKIFISGSTYIFTIIVLGLVFTKNIDFVLVILMAFAVLSMSSDKGFLDKILGCKIIYNLGLWSYSLYLIHPIPLLGFIRFKFDDLLSFLHIPYYHMISFFIMFLSLIVLSFLSYNYIEQPARKWLTKVFIKS